MIGRKVSHYEIVEKLGGGGMGVVYKARDLKLDRFVALKFLPTHLTGKDDPESRLLRERFEQEAKAASALDHANIATIHEIGETEDGETFIVMAYYDGETLKKKIARGPVPVSEAVELAVQMARGLAKAHEKGIVHRDIKPANVIVTEDGEVKIIDFGLAKFLDVTRITAPGSAVGTVAYMSPEQVRAENIDDRTDVWALGAVLYEMLTGQLPFRGAQAGAITHAILSREPDPPENLRPEVPPEISRILSRALLKNPRARPATSEILSELTLYASGAPPLASAVRASTRLASLRRPRIAVTAVALLLLLGSFIGWLVQRSQRVAWARTEALTEIRRLADREDYAAALALAEEVEKVIPDDPALADLWPLISGQVSIHTTPPGADVYVKEYAAAEAAWQHLGRSPIDKMRIPVGLKRWRIEKEGYVPEVRALPFALSEILTVALIETGRVPPEMIRIPGGQASGWLAGLDPLDQVQLDDFLMDRYEVTNEQFKAFVDAGGYRERKYWKHEFEREGRILTWDEAMKAFRDATARPGPATWQLGDYPEGHEDHPVAGVSWYEAAAYAEFAGKSLPTIYHWTYASGTYLNEAYITPLSNFAGTGPARGGSHDGMGPYGNYDMAGNVREWCWNRSGSLRYVLGGSWKDPEYYFGHAQARSPFDRSPENGIRSVRYFKEDRLDTARRSVSLSHRDYSKETPVSDDVFKVYREQFAYDRTPLNAKVESVDESARHWITEKVTFDAAYSGERVTAYIFKPRSLAPPYQTVIYFPGSSAIFTDSFRLGPRIDFLVKEGRALIAPIYKATYERREGLSSTWPNTTYRYVDYVTKWVKDLKRTLDYLETREDMDKEKLAYFGISWGGRMGIIIPAVEDRLKVSILYSGGLAPARARPEVDQINYVTRVRIPTLMLNGRLDSIEPLEEAQIPMVRLMGTPPEHKRHVTYDTGHLMPINSIIQESLDWLDRYLGPVR